MRFFHRDLASDPEGSLDKQADAATSGNVTEEPHTNEKK